jgi:hypothetical protein
MHKNKKFDRKVWWLRFEGYDEWVADTHQWRLDITISAPRHVPFGFSFAFYQ